MVGQRFILRERSSDTQKGKRLDGSHGRADALAKEKMSLPALDGINVNKDTVDTPGSYDDEFEDGCRLGMLTDVPVLLIAFIWFASTRQHGKTSQKSHIQSHCCPYSITEFEDCDAI